MHPCRKTHFDTQGTQSTELSVNELFSENQTADYALFLTKPTLGSQQINRTVF